MATADWETAVENVITSVRGFVERSIGPLGKRVGALEQQHGERVDKLEHRATRHSEHIARLETRLAALERRVGEK